MTGRTIHLVFKTHLDIGFTQLAETVRREYHEVFIPRAIDTGEHFFAEDPAQRMFVWTAGAWLIWDHLATQPRDKVRRLERAIARGLIRWHGLPFTTHTELMSPALFRAGMSYAQELDRRFGTATIAAKMTDVPGHPLGIVPILAEAGIRFLHIGVNSASTLPEVPPLFRWRAPSGEEVLVAYQSSYGATFFPAGMGQGLSFAHTSDNVGPQGISAAAECHREVRAANPGAVVRASSLDDFAAVIWPERERFPVVDREIGDSWIHGSASDPEKTARFLALQQVYDRFAEEGLDDRRLAFGRHLAMVAEHTCGVDVKTFLRDEAAWDRPDFEAERRRDPRFRFTETSWAEQRAYLDAAVDALSATDRPVADKALAELQPPDPAVAKAPGGSGLIEARAGGWRLGIDGTTGAVITLTAPDGGTLEGIGGSLIAYAYESYDATDVAAHMQGYLTHWLEWALLDHGKPGLERARTARSAVWRPCLAGLAQDGSGLTLLLDMPEDAHVVFGAPRRAELRIAAAEDGLDLVLVLRDKPANRMPEASFLDFTPAGIEGWDFRKMGLWQPADRITPKGGGQLQAVSGIRGRRTDGRVLSIQSLDAPLAAPAGSRFMPFASGLPDFSAGVRINLHNNKWGTNFPMWCEGTLQFRFRMQLKA
ncbi:DUF5054 domain-containing protein [Inquilinus limosus]|uniref:Glycosyl hydrolase n=1 Tax=Inquilinus limosus MP06 TaxID=1398085 RepID=A0A0A0D3A3_9PROT|nr:DUF5054 domain-containing protein [Inquilinus limosus]KGM33206.1 glycosyl hydrolase [Inquilinus limosus MP06]